MKKNDIIEQIRLQNECKMTITNERKSLLQKNILPHGSNRKRLHRKTESPERKGTEESRKSRHNGNGNG